MRLSENFTAGASKRFHIPGEFFAFDSVPGGSVDAVFYRDGFALSEDLIGVIGGWCIAPRGGFDLVEVSSSLSQLVSFYITRGPLRPSTISGAVSVTNFPAVQPVSGPLTDAQLRATPVPVSGNVGVIGTVDVLDLFLLDATFTGRINTQGQKTMAGSTPVVLPSDQSAIPVSGPLTDAQLRATAVPVSGPLTDAQARALAATLHVTATAAVNTGATASLPAAGAGLFHYITRVELRKRYSVVGIAAGAGIIVTSTNLPGAPAWDTEQLASPAGTVVKVIEEEHPLPMKSSVANTATTFVAGAQLQTIWRWNVWYYTGP